MTTAEIVDLAHRWINLQRVPQDSAAARELMGAAVQVNMLALRQPQDCWALVMTIFNQTSDEWVLTNLAAGPLESLVTRHPEEILPLLENEARNSERFRDMLSSVWENLMPEDAWRRIRAAR